MNSSTIYIHLRSNVEYYRIILGDAAVAQSLESKTYSKRGKNIQYQKPSNSLVFLLPSLNLESRAEAK